MEVKTEKSQATFTGLYFSLQGEQLDGYSNSELWMMAKEAAVEKMGFPHTIVMPCGLVKTFDKPDDILSLPVKDIACLCGNPNHYIVRFIDWRKKKEEEKSV